jgi:Tfp pilus assembly protein PilF
MRRLLLLLFLVLSSCDGGGNVSKDEAAKNQARSEDVRFTDAMNRGVGLMGRFQFSKAQEHFARALEIDPYSLDAQLDLAIARLNQVDAGAQEDAIREFARILERKPANATANYCTGLAHLYLGHPREALPHLRGLAARHTHDPYLAYFLGQALEQSDLFQEACDMYERSLSLDPFLRSSWLGLQRCNARLGKTHLADGALKKFEALSGNPRSRLAEFRYSRMGSLAMAVLPDDIDVSMDVGPATSAFDAPIPLVAAESNGPSESASIQPVDLDGDDDLDVVVSGWGADGTSRVYRNDDGAYVVDPLHPLAAVTAVNCMLFGDVDADGLVDAFLCRNGPNRLLLQMASGDWVQHPGIPENGDGSATVDGALADLDHDGDLDVYCVNADAHNELLNNDGAGVFSDIAVKSEVAGPPTGSRQVLVADLDLDRDVDLVVVNESPPNQVFINDRLWSYSRSSNFKALESEPIASIVGWYDTPEGRAALRVRSRDGVLSTWSSDDHDDWSRRDEIPLEGVATEGPVDVALADVTGDAQLELLVARAGGFQIHDGRNQLLARYELPDGKLIRFAEFVDQPRLGPSLLALTDDAGLMLFPAGTERGRFATVLFSGRTDESQQMRSNLNGIGTRYAARIGGSWQAGATWRNGSGPGQGLQPTAIGTGNATSIDFVDIIWPDGVFQSELAVPIGGPTLLAETQRQISSCPLVFVRGDEGAPFEFITDVLGVGGMGYLVEPGVAAPPRPVESLLLPGRPVEIRLAEPMEEACYLDAVRLVAVDLPEGEEIVLDERLGIEGAPPTSEVIPITGVLQPVKALNDRGEDVLEAVLEHDLRAADPGEVDPRFIGLLRQEHVLELEFAESIEDRDLLLAEGWVEYPYSQTNFAAWQSGTTYDPPTLEARTSEGDWVVIAERFGYPAGMPRAMCLPIDSLPEGCTALRLRSNQEIYWDRIRLARRSGVRFQAHSSDPISAELVRCGFPRRTTGDQRQPHYDYQDRAPMGDVRHQAGFYTGFGPCLPLVKQVDDACAIIGPGEEIRLRFGDPIAPEPGMKRHWVLELNGWCKDMDLFTVEGERLEPLPARATDGPGPEARGLMKRFNVRFASGQ